jgi:hypothetical protein
MMGGLGRFRVPLVSYYVVTVVVPLANGSGNTSRAFLEHMAFVLFAPPALVALVALFRHAARKARLLAPRAVSPTATDSPATDYRRIRQHRRRPCS